MRRPDPGQYELASTKLRPLGRGTLTGPTGFEAFAFDSELRGFVLSEQVEGDAVEGGKILRGMACALAIQVFAEADIQRPVEFVFDAPVLANGPVQPSGMGLEAGDMVAGLGFGFARCLVEAFCLDAHQPCKDAHSATFSTRLKSAITEQRRRSTRP